MAHRITFVAVPGLQLLDIAGPLDVFAEANRQAGKVIYQTRVAALRAKMVVSSSGMSLVAGCTLGELAQERGGTLIVAGAPDIGQRQFSPRVISQLTAALASAERFGSVCAGAVLLARTGLLAGRTITTHWEVADSVAARWPEINVRKNDIFVQDGNLWTAAGVTASLDLALAIVGHDCGEALAKKVASHLVMYFRRDGGQMQFSQKADVTLAGRSSLQTLQRWAMANLTDNLTTPALAERLGITPRHLSRMFCREIGSTPARWVAGLRLDRARQLLEQGAVPKQVACACGYSDVQILRRAFEREYGVTPAVYRRRNLMP